MITGGTKERIWRKGEERSGDENEKGGGGGEREREGGRGGGVKAGGENESGGEGVKRGGGKGGDTCERARKNEYEGERDRWVDGWRGKGR